MLNGIDISNWQRDIGIDSLCKADFVIVKATGGISYVDSSCDRFVQYCIAHNIPWGFYHFQNDDKKNRSATEEAEYFYKNCKNYFGKGIPILDYERYNTNATSWIEEFCKCIHDWSGVWPIIYMNSDYINNKKVCANSWVKQKCGLWLAGYPKNYTNYPANKNCPYRHNGWTLAIWQFTSSLSFAGKKLDGDIFYGDSSAWTMYAKGDTKPSATENKDTSTDLSSAIDVMAHAVIAGKFGNGQQRKDNIYNMVQKRVNELV